MKNKMKAMKFALALTAGIICSAIGYAQPTGAKQLFDKPDKLPDRKVNFKITIDTNNNISVTGRNRTIPIRTVQELDSCLKEFVASTEATNVMLESPSDTKKETMDAVQAILNKYKFNTYSSASFLHWHSGE